jgi:hypothetical protein
MNSASYDLLLAYLSELGSGAWQTFQTAVDAVSDEAQGQPESSHFVRVAMESLGHMEVASRGNGLWAIPPPTLVGIPSRKSSIAVLCGSRPQSLVSRVSECNFTYESQVGGPGRLLLRAETESALAEVANMLGFEWSPSFAGRLALMLPSTKRLFEQAFDEPAPIGWAVEKFSGERWFEVQSDDADGFYRYRHFTTEYRLRWKGVCRRLDRATGIYEYCRRTDRLLVEYDDTEERLVVPAVADLPPLASRCAVLCSGLLPTRTGNSLHYHNVPSRIGQLIRASLT